MVPIKKFGLIGEKLQHSISPEIHQDILEHLGIQGTYELFEVTDEAVPELLSKLRKEGYTGVNVTIPHKQRVIPFIGPVSSLVKETGVCNTIHIENNMNGYNTDYDGFKAMVTDAKIQCENRSVIILGDSATKNTLIAYLQDAKAKEIYVVSRKIEKTKKDTMGITYLNYKALDETLFNQALIINTTPVGMFPHMDHTPLENFNYTQAYALVDLIYNPTPTCFTQYGIEHHIKWVNGLYMLVAQAVKAQEIWNQVSIPETIIQTIFEKQKRRLL